jgi:hypothetical protein
MSILNLFAVCFVSAFGLISGVAVSVVLYLYLLNMLCEWSLDKELAKKNKDTVKRAEEYVSEFLKEKEKNA